MWREFLLQGRQGVDVLEQGRHNGLDADDCEGLRTLAWTFPDPLRGLPKTPIVPVRMPPYADAGGPI